MPELSLLANGKLVVTRKDSWYEAELVVSGATMHLGCLVGVRAGELQIFLDECGTGFDFTDNRDNDLPSSALSLRCRTITGGVATIILCAESCCSLEGVSTWKAMVNEALRLSSKLDGAAYDASVDIMDDFIVLRSSLTLHASDQRLREFVAELLEE